MTRHWEGRINGRGLWPRGTTADQLPGLFADPDHGPRRREWLESYYNEVEDCLEWMGGRLPFGYGIVNIGGRSMKAHRVAYAMYHGVDPGEMRVCHRCDNPPCGLEVHLFLGTDSDNMQDMVSKGRTNPARGEKMPHSILTEQKVREMRWLHQKLGWGTRTLAQHFGVGRMTAKYAVLGITWAHVEGISEPKAHRDEVRQGKDGKRSKLDAEKVREIRRLHEEGQTYLDIAGRFKVDRKTIREVVTRVTWSHVD